MLTTKFRPRKWSQLVGQESAVKILSRQSMSDKFSNVYVLAGHFGCGKTTAARILARALNCSHKEADGSPCGVCDSCRAILEGRCVDYYEIDAASRSGVDDTRKLVELASYAPVELNKKVIVIDEVHRLSGAAFDSLLKTLEEPPDNVVFILCTTKITAIPATILSRSTRINFKSIPPAIMKQKLLSIAESCGRSVEPDAVAFLVKHSNGALRDAEVNLDQAFNITDGVVTLSVVREMLACADEGDVVDILSAVLRKDSEDVFKLCKKLYSEATDIASVLRASMELICDAMQYASGFTLEDSGERHMAYVERLVDLTKELSVYRYMYRSLEKLQGKVSSDLSYDTLLCGFLDMCFLDDGDEVSVLVSDLLRRVNELEGALSSGNFKSLVPAFDDVCDNSPISECDNVSAAAECNKDVHDFSTEDDMPQDTTDFIPEEETKACDEVPFTESKVVEPQEEVKKNSDSPLFSFDAFDGFIFRDTKKEPEKEEVACDCDTDCLGDSVPDELVSFDGFAPCDTKDVPFVAKGLSLSDAKLKDRALKACIEYLAQESDGEIATPYPFAKDVIECCLDNYNVCDVSVSVKDFS